MTPTISGGFLPSHEVNVTWRTDGDFAPSRVSELSRTGAFISTAFPAAVGKILALRLMVPEGEICAQAVVRRVLPGRGMGVEFESLGGDDRGRLDLLVRQMELELLSEAGRSAASSASEAPIAALAADPARPRRRSQGAERRARVRHKFSATAELTRAGAFEPVSAEVADLAKGGCYVILAEPFPVVTSLQIAITSTGNTFHARALVASTHPGRGMGLAFAEVDAKDLLVLNGWLATSMERTWLASNRRRSQRILVNIPVQVAAKNTFGTNVSEDTRTISVSAHGALLQLSMDVTRGQTIMLRNATTNNALECSVDYLGTARDGLREVGVSFVLPNRTLWQIAFPPPDWSPQHPCAKTHIG